MPELMDSEELRLKEKQLDYCLVYMDEDVQKASEIHAVLTQLGYDGRLFDDKMPFDDWYIELEPQIINDLFQRSTYILFCASTNLSSGNSREFMFNKCQLIQQYIDNPESNRFLPVWLGKRSEIRKAAGDYLFGLTAMNGFNAESKYFKDEIKRLFDSRISTNMKKKREQRFEDRLAAYQEKKRNAGTIERVLTSNNVPKSHAGRRPNMKPVYKEGTVVYHIKIENAGRVVIGDQEENAVTSVQSSERAGETLDSYTVPPSIWESFSNEECTDSLQHDAPMSIAQQPSDASNDLTMDVATHPSRHSSQPPNDSIVPAGAVTSPPGAAEPMDTDVTTPKAYVGNRAAELDDQPGTEVSLSSGVTGPMSCIGLE